MWFKKHRIGLLLLLSGFIGMAAFFTVLFHVEYSNLNLWPILKPLRILCLISLGILALAVLVTAPEVLCIPLFGMITILLFITPRYDQTTETKKHDFKEEAQYGWPWIYLHVHTTGWPNPITKNNMVYARKFHVLWWPVFVNTFAGFAGTGVIIYTKVAARRRKNRLLAAREKG
jgi:hypothetical protein